MATAGAADRSRLATKRHEKTRKAELPFSCLLVLLCGQKMPHSKKRKPPRADAHGSTSCGLAVLVLQRSDDAAFCVEARRKTAARRTGPRFTGFKALTNATAESLEDRWDEAVQSTHLWSPEPVGRVWNLRRIKLERSESCRLLKSSVTFERWRLPNRDAECYRQSLRRGTVDSGRLAENFPFKLARHSVLAASPAES